MLEEQNDDDELADDEPTASSFFDVDREDSDLTVCTRIWKLYLRSSVERGHASISEQKNDRSEGDDTIERKRRQNERRALAQPTTELPAPTTETTTMPSRPNNELRSSINEVHRKLTQEHKRAPTIGEVFDSVGVDAAKSPANVRQTLIRMGLDFTRSTRGPTKNPKRVKANGGGNGHANGHTNGNTNGHAKRAKKDDAPLSTSTTSYLAIMALEADRAKLVADMAAIDRVIERLRVGGP